MVSGGAFIRRAGAASRALPRILHRNYSKKECIGQPFPWANACRQLAEHGPGSTYELTSPLAMHQEAKERVCTRTLAYEVRRRDPELVGPTAQTPRETKRLSDLDDNDMLRMHVSLAFFYRGGEDGVDPAGVIRRALGQALVHYYPLAGRLREIEGRKLVVDCTGEGVLFVQADADVKLAELEAAGLSPPFRCWDQLLFDVEGSSSGVLNCPLMLIQVTRLLCGGFVFALRFIHTICDGIGIIQFINAVAELARGLPSTTVAPVWYRELLKARKPPMSSVPRRDIEVLPPPAPPGDMVMRSFTFGALDVAAMKKSLPLHLRDTASTFEALAPFIWRARTAALEIPPGEDAPLLIPSNIRGAAKMSLPAGYYGNAVVFSTALVDAAALRRGPLGDAVVLAQQAKAAVTTEYVLAVVDELVRLGRRWFRPANMFWLSDTRNLGFDRVDFGWGEPVFAGPANAIFGGSFFISVKDRDGEDAVAVPIVLPRLAMDRFASEVDMSLLRLKLNPATPQSS